MSSISEQDIANLKNQYIISKTLYEQTQIQNKQSISEIKNILSSITMEELQSIKDLDIDISKILNTDIDSLASDIEAYEMFQDELNRVIETLYSMLSSKLAEVK